MGLYDGASAPTASPPPPTSRRCWTRRWCSSSTPPRSRRVGGRAGARASRPTTRACGSAGVDPQPGRLRPARGDAPRGARRRRRAGARRAAAATTRSPRRPGTSAWCPAAERDRGRRDGGRLAALVAGASTWTPCSRWPARRRRSGRAWDPPRDGRAPSAGPARWSPSPAGARSPSRYAETAELLAAAGAEVVPFDPLRDEHAARRHAGLVHRRRLPRGVRRRAVRQRAAARRGRPPSPPGCRSVAECAGLLYLCPAARRRGRCAGCSTPTRRMTGRLTLGYREASRRRDIAARRGRASRVRGHEFHRTAVTRAAGGYPAWDIDGEPIGVASPAPCTPPTCTCTGRAAPSWRSGSPRRPRRRPRSRRRRVGRRRVESACHRSRRCAAGRAAAPPRRPRDRSRPGGLRGERPPRGSPRLAGVRAGRRRA